MNDKEVVEFYRWAFEGEGIDISTVKQCWVSEGVMCYYDTNGDFHTFECGL